MIDSCLHLKKNSFAHIKYISNKIKLLKIRKAFCYYDLEKTNSDRKNFYNDALIIIENNFEKMKLIQ